MGIFYEKLLIRRIENENNFRLESNHYDVSFVSYARFIV